jgi:hypothetical protein
LTDERRQARWVLAVAVVAWALVSVPLATGARTFYLRDVLSVHAPWKAFGAEALREGSIPAFNPTWALGQPFRGNPNALPLYPGNLLYLALPFWVAFNLHFALHWLLSLFTFRALARALGMRPLAAALAAVTFAASGYVLSCLTFYNLIAFVAWWPLVMWGAVVGGKRGIALGGLACGLALFSGEPVSLALGGVPLLLAAGERHGWRRGALISLAIAGAGALVALPQLVASARIVEFTFRGGHGALPSQAVSYTLHPLRWVELLLPLPFGNPARVGGSGWWATRLSPNEPLFFSLYFGCVGLWLALRATARRRWLLLAGLGLVLSWLLGGSGAALVTWTAGLFRYPEKLLLWPALALPLCVGWSLESITADPRRAARHALVGAAGTALLMCLALGLRPWLQARMAAAPAVTPETSLALGRISSGWIRDLAIATALLGAAAHLARRSRLDGIAWLQFAALLQLYPLAATAPASVLERPVEWAAEVPAGAAVVNTAAIYPLWERVTFALGEAPAWARAEIERQELMPWAGVARGWTYPLAPDVEGTQSPLHGLVMYNLPKFDLEHRVRWLRVLGVDRLVLHHEPPTADLKMLAATSRGGVSSRLYAILSTQPAVSWPDEVEAAENPAAVLRQTTFGEQDPLRVAVVPEPVAHQRGGSVEMRSETPSRIVLATRGPGGLVVVRRSYQPLYRARSGGETLPTLPVNLALLGVVVPAGEREITIDESAAPELAGAVIACVAAAAMVAVGWRRPRV